jgi:hypothetical protein
MLSGKGIAIRFFKTTLNNLVKANKGTIRASSLFLSKRYKTIEINSIQSASTKKRLR